MEKAEPVRAKVKPVFDQIGPVIEKIGPALDSINAAAAKVGPAIDRFRPVVDRAVVVVVERTGVLIQSVNRVTAAANLIMQDVRPVSRTSLTKPSPSSVPGANRSSAWATFSTTRATAPMPVPEQIDHAVEATIKQSENVSGTVKSAVLRPVREVSGIAAGISAMVATVVRGRHKSSGLRPPRTRKCSYRGGPYVGGLTAHKHRQPNPIPSNFRLQIEEFAGLSRAAPDAALLRRGQRCSGSSKNGHRRDSLPTFRNIFRSEEHTSELQSLRHLVCRLL